MTNSIKTMSVNGVKITLLPTGKTELLIPSGWNSDRIKEWHKYNDHFIKSFKEQPSIISETNLAIQTELNKRS